MCTRIELECVPVYGKLVFPVKSWILRSGISKFSFLESEAGYSIDTCVQCTKKELESVSVHGKSRKMP